MMQRDPRHNSWWGVTVALAIMAGVVLPGARLADVQTPPAVAAPRATATAGNLSLPATAVPAVATPGTPAGANSALQGAGATQLENFRRPSRPKPIAPSPEAQGWTTLMAEDFEGDFPGTTWTLYGDPTWDDVNFRAFSGAWSGYCAAAGSGAVSPPGPYPNDMNAWMVFGPFDLSRATDAELLFFHWTKTEGPEYDKFWVLAWDGVNESWWGSWWSGDFVAECGGWCEKNFDLTNVGDLGNLAGQPEVWIAFKFESDSSVADEGTYVDNVILRAFVAGEGPTPTPTATRPPSGGDIYGQVTRNGAAARDGTELELRFYDGNTWSTAATTTTAGGTYHFRDLPTLGVDQVYYVRYQNAAAADGYLWGWFCEFLLSYTAGTDLRGCDFDIADVALGFPDGPSPRPLPVTFNWAIRSNVPSDTYRFHMWDPDTIAEYVTDNLDRAGSFTLEFLPPGFGVGQPYSWDVWVVGPGGLGVSLGTHTVTLELAGPAVRESFLPLIMRNFGVAPSPVPLNNGNFESGSLQPDWLSGGQLPASVTGGNTPHGGVYAAQLGDPALGPGFPQSNLPVGSGWIEQEFTVPASGSPRLAFWYRIFTYDKAYSPSTTEFWDTLVVTVRGDTVFRDGFCWHQGSVNETECRTWTPRLRDLGWQQGSIDLSPYRGQTVRVRFATWNDETVFRKRGDTGAGAYNTYTYVDDVQLIP